jgi:hypothetical protein
MTKFLKFAARGRGASDNNKARTIITRSVDCRPRLVCRWQCDDRGHLVCIWVSANASLSQDRHLEEEGLRAAA